MQLSKSILLPNARTAHCTLADLLAHKRYSHANIRAVLASSRANLMVTASIHTSNENSDITRLRPDSASRLRRSKSTINRVIWRAKSSGSPGADNNPVSSCKINSGIAATRVATHATPYTGLHQDVGNTPSGAISGNFTRKNEDVSIFIGVDDFLLVLSS